jgi:Holliday junction resolvase RusA-like endonuclease
MAIRKGGVYTGKAVAFENNHKKTHAWRDTVADSAIDAIEDWQEATGRPWALLDAPLLVECVFSMARPGKPKFDRPATVPDLSKLIRATEDALTRIVWRDDSRVVEYGRLAKVWAGSTDPEALPFPGAQIRIWRKQ